MIKRVTALCTLVALNLNATGLLIENSGELRYTITHGTFTRPTGLIIDVPTQFGTVKTETGIKYQTAEIIVHDEAISLVLSDSLMPISRTFKKWLPTLSKVSAHMLSLEAEISSAERCFLCELFADTSDENNYISIADAPRTVQFKFLVLMHFMQKKFPEITFQYQIPFFTKLLYYLGLSGW